MDSNRSYDVLIVGGGIAGVAAALECTRSGLRVAVVEKTILWGGMATSGLVPIYMPLCDGRGRQVTLGIAEELLWASIKYGPGRVPSRWADRAAQHARERADIRADEEVTELYPEAKFEDRYIVAYSCPAFALGLDELMEQCGADLWLDTLACTPIISGNRVRGVEVENKSGRIAVEATCIIDASGDADVAFRAGAPCEERGSYPSFLYQYTSLALAREAVEADCAKRLVTWHPGGSSNEMDKGYDGPSPKRSGVRGKDVSAFLVESRRIARQKLAAEQAQAAAGDAEGRENVYPAALPTMHQIRMTRMIQGQETVLTDRRNQRCDSSVGLIADCRKTDAVWEVPYGSLLPKKVEGLLVVGRCSSAEGYAWQVTRLIPAVALTGQVAGIAARLAAEQGTLPHKLAVADVQQAAEARGIVLHL